MNIALIGYGKMGKAIEEIAVTRGHEIVLKIDEHNLPDFTKENISKAYYENLFLRDQIRTAWEETLRFLTEHAKWNEGDLNNWFLNQKAKKKNSNYFPN